MTAYLAYWAVVDQTGADPGNDWTAQVDGVAAGPVRDGLLETAKETAARGQRAVGTTTVEPMVTEVEAALVSIDACVDKSDTDFLDSSGTSIKAPNAAGTYFRHPATAQVGQFQDGRWLVAATTDDWSKTC